MRVIDIHGPADEPFVSVARTAAVAFASSAGLAIDQCDELRLALHEACGLLLDADAVDLTFAEDGHSLSMSLRPSAPVACRLSPQSELVLKTMTDRFVLDQDGMITLEKLL